MSPLPWFARVRGPYAWPKSRTYPAGTAASGLWKLTLTVPIGSVGVALAGADACDSFVLVSTAVTT